MLKNRIEVVRIIVLFTCVFVQCMLLQIAYNTQFYFYFILIIVVLLSRVKYREQQLKLHNEAKQKAKELALEQEIEKQKRLDRLRQQVKEILLFKKSW